MFVLKVSTTNFSIGKKMVRMYSSGDCLYSILGVNQDANDSELKLAYFKLAKQYHPDVNSSNEATQMFIDINNAYEVLADKDKRTQYDERRKRKAYRHEKRPHDKSMEDIIRFWNKMNTDEFRTADRPFDIHCTKVYGGNHSGAHNYKNANHSPAFLALLLFFLATILYISSEIYFQMNIANRHKENMKKHLFGAHTNCKYCIEEASKAAAQTPK